MTDEREKIRTVTGEPVTDTHGDQVYVGSIVAKGLKGLGHGNRVSYRRVSRVDDEYEVVELNKMFDPKTDFFSVFSLEFLKECTVIGYQETPDSEILTSVKEFDKLVSLQKRPKDEQETT